MLFTGREDNDGKYPVQFDEVFEVENVEIVRTCVRAPNNERIHRTLVATASGQV
jgi:hypothetical protein